LGRIAITESFFSKIGEFLYGKISSLFNTVISIIDKMGIKNLWNSIEKDLPRLRQEAKRVSMEQDVPNLSEYDVREFARRIEDQFPTVPSDLEVKWKLGEAYEDPKGFSTRRFIQKTILAGILYGIALWVMGLTGGFWGLISKIFSLKMPIYFLPVIVGALDDLFHGLNVKEYITP
jgi:hypothetical protein